MKKSKKMYEGVKTYSTREGALYIKIEDIIMHPDFDGEVSELKKAYSKLQKKNE